MTRISIGTADYPFDRARYQSAFEVVEVAVGRTRPPGLKTLIKWAAETPDTFEHIWPARLAFTVPVDKVPKKHRFECAEGENPYNLGHLRFTPENVRLWAEIKEEAAALNARRILLETPSTLTPSPANKTAIEAFANDWSDLPDGSSIVWAPSGFWEREEAAALAATIGWELAIDPLLDPEEPLPESERAYFRLLGARGLGGAYGEHDLERVLDATLDYDQVTIILKTRSALDDARRLTKLVKGAEGD